MNNYISVFLKETYRKFNTEWNIKRRLNIIFELLCLFIIICLFAAGIIFDIVVTNGNIKYNVNDFNSFIIAILGIQATIGTLTIALVALISNNISESYMGISISYYYLNIRPFIFKQSIIIYTVMILQLINTVNYIFGKYNLIVFLFIVTIVLVVLSACEIYAIFNGVASAISEIKLYTYHIKDLPIKKKYYKLKIYFLENLVNDWSQKSYNQNKLDYDDYKKIFIYSFRNILLYNTDKSLLELNKISEKEIYSMLHVQNDIVQGRGIDLLREIYDEIWAFVISEDYKKTNNKTFNLFSNLFDTLSDVLRKMPIDTIDDILEWKYMSDKISRVAFSLMPIDQEVEFSLELQANIKFSLLMGYILQYKTQRKKEILNPIINRWGRSLYEPFLNSSDNIIDKRKAQFLYHKSKVYFFYCRGFIENRLTNVIKENIFYRGLSNIYWEISNTEILYYLSIDCYLYYLAEKESEMCIDKKLKKSALKILEDKNVRGINEYYYFKIGLYINEYISLEEDLQSLLKGCEWDTKYTNGKTLIMENVVREFYVFSALLMYYKNKNGELKLNLKEMPYIYTNQFLESQKENTIKNLKRFYFFFTNNNTYDNYDFIDIDINKMYNLLDQLIKKSYKEEEIKKAKEDQEKYICDIKLDAVIESIKKKVYNHMENTFNVLNVEKCEDNIQWISTFKLLDVNLFTNMVNDNVVDSMYSDVDASFIGYIIYELKKRKFVTEVKRSKWPNDLDYINFLKEKNLSILLGNEYVLKNNDYTYTNAYKEFQSNCQSIYAGYYQSGGLALKKGSLQIRLISVDVSIRPLSLDDAVAEYNEKEDTFSYNVTNNIYIPFKKEEFIVYINNKRKLLNISMDVEIIVNGNDIGFAITRDNN